jgi:hypothetical protein
MAFKGNLPEKASLSFRQALALNPLLWEAFEGLCALGMLSLCYLTFSGKLTLAQAPYLRSMKFSPHVLHL